MELMNNRVGSPAIEIFSTHPSEESRFENLQKHLPAALDVRDKCQVSYMLHKSTDSSSCILLVSNCLQQRFLNFCSARSCHFSI